MTAAHLLDLGRMPYARALGLQRAIHAEVAAELRPDTWLVVEHDPVVTLGRNASRRHLRLDSAALAGRGIDVVAVERGGDVTYHGPGQLVVYPIVKLARFREVVPFVSALERAAIGALATFGLPATTRAEHRGVYVDDRAICALGLTVKRMTTMHGLALNVTTALDYDRLIVPCGTPQFGITSLARELGCEIAMAAVADRLLRALATECGIAFERRLAERLPVELPPGELLPSERLPAVPSPFAEASR